MFMGQIRVSPRVVLGRHVSRQMKGQRSRVSRLVTVLAGVVGLVTAITSTAAADQALRQAPLVGAVDYVALGDSYSSGVGTGVYDSASGACARSPLSYPPLWAAEHRPASFGFVACSGAKTADVMANQI